MKRFLLILVTLAMLLALAACSVEEVQEILDTASDVAELELVEAIPEDEEPAEAAQEPDAEPIDDSQREDEPAPAAEETEEPEDLELEEGVEIDDSWDEPEEESENEQPAEEAPAPEEAQGETLEIVPPDLDEVTSNSTLDEDGQYYSKDDVALYIYTYGHLPDNYITKKQAQKLGWEGGKLEPYAPGKAIGGDHFGNYEGLLPTKKGRKYTECDIDTKGKKRGAKRIIFSNDGLIYYTDDHYESFELLYGEP